MKPITREEAMSEAFIGDQRERVLALLDDRDALVAERNQARALLVMLCMESAELIAKRPMCGDPDAECPLFDVHKPWHPFAKALGAGEADAAPWLAEHDAKVRRQVEAEINAEWAAIQEPGKHPNERDVIEQHDARVRIAALTDAPFVAAALEAKRLETIDAVANHVARCMVSIESPDRVKTCAAIIADIRALKETP
jgi:hypothetical protein